jgi:septal ring factor EnvC (AmiA/AmiB activator)
MFRRVLITALLVATAAWAQPSKQATELSQVETEQQARESERAEALREADQARREIAELTAQLNELGAAQAHGEGAVSEKRLKLAALNAREAVLEAKAGANQNRLAHLLGALQMFSREPPPALLLHADDAKDAVRAAILIRAMTPDLEKQARAYAGQAQSAKAARRDAAAQSESLFSAESDVAEKSRLEKGLSGEAALAAQQIAALSARADALRSVLGRLPAAPTAPGRLGPVKALQSPVEGEPSVRFGDIDSSGRPSEGWTWTAPPAARIVAPAGGLVDFAGPVEGWKIVVILNLGNNTRLVLTGLDLPLVEAGQSVTTGQVIGRMAKPDHLGVRSGGDLHLEVRKNRQTVDPASMMARR